MRGRRLRLLLLLLLFFGFFYGFAEVRDGGDVGGLEDVFAHEAPADVAGGNLRAGSGSHVRTSAVAGSVDDETVLGGAGADFGLLFGARVLRHGLVGGAGRSAFLAAEADGVIGLLD